MNPPLVTENPDIMEGRPCFAGTRVPIDIVLASLDAGKSLAEVREAYAFVTEAHVAAARNYEANRPRRPPQRLGEAWPGLRLVCSHNVKLDHKDRKR
jgi:uncharacterized protein (DUF433 family)